MLQTFAANQLSQNQRICSLNEIGAKLKLQYFGHSDYTEQREATETMGLRYKGLDRPGCTTV